MSTIHNMRTGAADPRLLAFIAFLARRTAKQTRELQQRVDTLVTVCAWSHTVKYQGEWISFEEYLLRQFKINTSHGISPAQAERIIKEVMDGEQPS